MAVVLDCSIAMAWCFADEADELADRVLDAISVSEARVPQVWALEVANVLLSAERRGRVTEADSTRFLGLLGDLPIHIDERASSTAFTGVLATARRCGLTAYDAAYLDLAMRVELPLATRDEQLRAACRDVGVALFE